MEMRGSRTEKNLMAAFAGESQARNRYSFYAKVAEQEGYVQIAQIFLETADNERAHAYNFWSLLDGGMLEVGASYPAGPEHDTLQNLRDAADGELLEWGTLYPAFADIAEEEGFNKVAAVFRKTLNAEQYHERRYRKLLALIDADQVFERPEPTFWKCEECGYVHEGPGAPKTCPLCGKPRSYFQVYADTY